MIFLPQKQDFERVDQVVTDKPDFLTRIIYNHILNNQLTYFKYDISW